eukprot:UN12676
MYELLMIFILLLICYLWNSVFFVFVLYIVK